MNINIKIVSSNKKSAYVFATRSVNDNRIKKLDSIYQNSANFLKDYQKLAQKNKERGYNGLRKFPLNNEMGLIITGRSGDKTVSAKLFLKNFGKLLNNASLEDVTEIIKDNMQFVEKWSDYKS